MGRSTRNYETFDAEATKGLLGNPEECITPAKKKITKHQLSIIAVLCLGQFCLAASISLQAPFFPGEAQKKQTSATIYGFIFGAFELAVIVSSPVYGKIIVWVNPRFLINAGLFSVGTCSLLFGFLDKCPGGTPFITLAFLLRISEGLSCAAVTTASYTIIATVCKEKVATFYSLLGTSFGLGLIVGPTVGGLLYQVGGFGLPFHVVGCVFFLATICGWSVLPADEGEMLESGKIRPFLSDFGIILYSFSIITSFMFIGYYTTNLELYLRQFHLKPALIGLIFVITGSIYGITSPLWGYICDKGVDPNIITIGGCSLVCTCILLLGPVPFIPVNPKLWLIILSLVIGGLGLAAKIVCALIGSLKNATSRGFPEDISTNGLVSAMFSSTTSIGAFIGPSLGGYLWDSVGFRKGSVVYLCDEFVFMALLATYFIWNRRRVTRLQSERKDESRLRLLLESDRYDDLSISI